MKSIGNMIMDEQSLDITKTLDKLIDLLKSSDPYKIILFGSHANGHPNEHSDIDLVVILDNDHVAKTYQERLDKRLRIGKSVLEVNRKVALDLLVYSKEEGESSGNMEILSFMK